MVADHLLSSSVAFAYDICHQRRNTEKVWARRQESHGSSTLTSRKLTPCGSVQIEMKLRAQEHEPFRSRALPTVIIPDREGDTAMRECYRRRLAISEVHF